MSGSNLIFSTSTGGNAGVRSTNPLSARRNANQWEWCNTASAVSGTAPTTLISGIVAVDAWLRGLDLTLLGSGKTLVNLSSTGSGMMLIDKCKIGASVTVATIGSDLTTVILSKCDSGTKNYRDEVYTFSGALTTETTIVRTAGQSDETTAASRKLVTTANALWHMAMEGPPIAIWNETVGSSVTVTLYGIWGGGAVPNNDDFWIDVEYLGSSATPISSRQLQSRRPSSQATRRCRPIAPHGAAQPRRSRRA
ncbi:hypothetical protein ACVWXO_005370 [Bradyrhizobium sp. LM2.7]